MFPPFTEMPFTYMLCGILILLSITGFYYRPLYNALLFHPVEFFKGKRILTIFTSAFVHNSWWHLFINIYIFYRVIRDIEYIILENTYSLISIKLICFITVFSGIVLPNLVVGLKNRENINYSTVGFSGAVFSSMGFSLLYLPLDHPQKPFTLLPLFYAYEFACVLFIVVTLMALVFKKSKTNHIVHLLGLVTGFLLAIVFRPALIAELIDHFK